MKKIYIIIFLIILFIIGILLLWHYYPSLSQRDKWKLFKDEELEFQISYPDDWYTFIDSHKFRVISNLEQEEFEQYYADQNNVDFDQGFVSITIDDINDSLHIGIGDMLKGYMEEFAEGNKSGTKEFFIEDIKIHGIEGYKIYYHGNKLLPGDISRNGISVYYSLRPIDRLHIYQIEGRFFHENEEVYKKYSDIFEEMISSFKLLED